MIINLQKEIFYSKYSFVLHLLTSQILTSYNNQIGNATNDIVNMSEVGGNDGGNYQDNNNGMFAETIHKPGRQQVQFCQQPAKYRQFKQNPHPGTHQQQSFYIGLERYHIDDIATGLIGSQKSKSQREYQKIAEQQAKNEHCISTASHTQGVFFLIRIYCCFDYNLVIDFLILFDCHIVVWNFSNI